MGGEQALGLEPLQRCVHSADRVIAFSALAQVVTHGEPIGIVTEASDGEQGGQFKGAERGVGH